MAEYLSRAMAFAQGAAKLSLRFSEGLVENALEFGLDTPGSFYDNAEFKLSQVRQELASASDKDKLTALKRLLAAIGKGHDVSEFFADVVKNVASGNLELRRLVYIYLLRYAEQEQDLALLSINTFQRDLADQNQVIRAMALRVMSSIRVPVISSIVMLAVRKCAADPSPHVRKTAAFAVLKLMRLDPGLREELCTVVAGMLGESSPLAVGAVIQAFQAVCPEKTELVHGQFRRWCQMVVDLDSWGQVELVKLLTRYARTQFENPAGVVTQLTAAQALAEDSQQFYGEPQAHGASKRLDPDHAVLLRALHPLLQSRNSAVVMAAVSAHYHLAPDDMLDVVGRPLVRLMRSSRETGFVALTNILLVAQRRPQAFREHVRSFFIAAGDARFARKLKLQVLGAIVSRDTVNTMVPELASYAKSPRTDVSIGAINVIVKCARAVGETAMDCFRSLLLMLDDSRGDVLGAAMQAISVLLRDGTVRDAPMRQGSATLYDILCYLVRALDRLKSDQTRASVFGLVATFVESRFGTLHSLDVLRGAARSFKEEGELAKVQILELAVRIVVARKDPDIQSDSTTTMAAEDLRAYVFTLARYDVSFVVRDRARLLRALCPLGGDEDHTAEMPHVAELASEILVGAQALTARGSAALAKYRAPQHIVSSLSLVLDRPIGGYEALSDWPATKPVGVNRGGTQETGRVVGGRKQEHVGAGAPSAITIAGLSGRAKPFQQNTSDYSTPRSVGGDDLDAFLNSDSDPTTSPMISGRSAGFVHSERSLHRTAVVLRQAEIHSDDESDYSPSESESSALSSGEEDESESESGESGESEEEEEDTGDESEEDEDDSEDGSDDERNPFLPSDASAAITDNPFVSTGVPDRSPDEPAEFDADQHSSSQTKPLFEDTTKYWQ